MGLLIRTLLIWLLVLAAPAQAAAAATMAFCGPNHIGGGLASVARQAPVAEHSHEGSGAQAADGHHAGATLPDEGAVAVTGVAVAAMLAQADTPKCSACASCCSVGALFYTVAAAPASPIGATLFTAAVPPVVDPFTTDGPDRPPRVRLA